MNDILKSSKSISLQICERFKSEIQNGKYNENEPLPSYGALALSYGISKSTIHEAFKHLSEEGFLYLKQGKGAFINIDKVLKKRKTKVKNVAVIAFNIFSANDNYMIPFLDSLNTTASSEDIKLNFLFIQGLSILDSANKMVKNAIADGEFDAIIVASPIDIVDIKWLTSLHIPFVTATSRYNLDIPQILIDNSLAVKLAVKELKKCKSRNIAIFTGPLDWHRDKIIPYAKDIYDVFQEELKNADISYDFYTCEYNYSNAKSIASKINFKEKKFDSIFFQSDIIAKGSLAAFKDNNMDIDNITQINYCDLEEYISPITIMKPLSRMGKTAIEILQSIFNGQKLKNNIKILKPILL